MSIKPILVALLLPSSLLAHEFSGKEVVCKNDHRKVYIYFMSDNKRVIQFNVGRDHPAYFSDKRITTDAFDVAPDGTYPSDHIAPLGKQVSYEVFLHGTEYLNHLTVPTMRYHAEELVGFTFVQEQNGDFIGSHGGTRGYYLDITSYGGGEFAFQCTRHYGSLDSSDLLTARCGTPIHIEKFNESFAAYGGEKGGFECNIF